MVRAVVVKACAVAVSLVLPLRPLVSMLVPVRLVVTEFDPELFVDDEFEVLDEPDSSLEAVELSQADKPSARTASDVGMNESRGCIGTPWRNC